VNIKCLACDAMLEAHDTDAVVDTFVANGQEIHAWDYPEQAGTRQGDAPPG
jgi:hypothetical protein